MARPTAHFQLAGAPLKPTRWCNQLRRSAPFADAWPSTLLKQVGNVLSVAGVAGRTERSKLDYLARCDVGVFGSIRGRKRVLTPQNVRELAVATHDERSPLTLWPAASKNIVWPGRPLNPSARP